MDIKKFVPELSHSGSKINAKEEGNKLLLETNGYNKSRVTLNRHIKPMNLFWFGLGLYEAEKSKNVVQSDGRLMASKVAFTNKDPKVIRTIIEAFEIMGIEKCMWKGEIEANINHINKTMFEKQAPKYWSEQTGIPEDRLKHFKYDKRKPKNYVKKYTNKFLGIITIYQYNLCLKSFIDSFIKNIPLS